MTTAITRMAAPADAEAEQALARVQREVFGCLHEFVERKLLSIPRQHWMEAFEYRGAGSTRDRAKVIQTIYENATPVPALGDDIADEFLREIRILTHEAIKDGGGELVSDVLGLRMSGTVQGRGRLTRERTDLVQWRDAVDALLQRSMPAFPATTLGL